MNDDYTVYIIAHKFPPDKGLTGGHMHAYWLYKELKNKGYPVKVTSVSNSPHVSKTIRLPVFRYILPLETVLYSLLSSMWILYDSLKDRRKIIVHSEGNGLHLVGIILKIVSLGRIKFVMTQHLSEPYFIREAIKGFKKLRSLPNSMYILPNYILNYIIEKLAFVFSDKVICVSESIKRECIDFGVSEKKLTVIYNAVYPVEDLSKDVGKYFLFFGVELKRKGFDILLDAFDSYIEKGGTRDLYVCGVDKIDHSTKKVKAQGFVSGETKEAMFKNCFALVAPSRYDSGPITVIEALSYGRPVLLSKNTGLYEYVSKNGFGFVIDLDPEMISNYMIQLENDTGYDEMRENIRNNFNLYWPVVVDQFIEVYKGVEK